MDNRLFRDAMGKFATGITVITTEFNNKVYGMTVNAFMSVSLEPKLIAISIDEKASMFEILQETNKFGISVLKDSQKDISMIFAKQKDQDKDINYKYMNGVPVINDSLATLACDVQTSVMAGDHLIFIAEVNDLSLNDGEPVLYFGGEYREIKRKI